MTSLSRPPLQLDVSLWSADLCDLKTDIARMDEFADSYHLDVADGHLVPALLFFPDLVARIRQLTRKPLHAHLMVEEPKRWIPEFREAGVDWITVPLERVCDGIDGIALDPQTPLSQAEPWFDRVQTVLLLGTQPGIKGVGLNQEAPQRIRDLCAMRGARKFSIIADGGIRPHTVPQLREAGADWIVPGSLLFGSDNPSQTVQWLKSL